MLWSSSGYIISSELSDLNPKEMYFPSCLHLVVLFVSETLFLPFLSLEGGSNRHSTWCAASCFSSMGGLEQWQLA